MVARQYEYGTSPRKLHPQKEEESVRKLKAKNKAKAKKQKLLRKLRLFATIALVFIAMLAICYRYSLINQNFKDIQGIKKEYIALQATNDQIEIGIQSQLDLNNIERYAKDKLGMQKPTTDQIKYVEILKENKVELNPNILQEKNVFQNIFDEILKLLD